LTLYGIAERETEMENDLLSLQEAGNLSRRELEVFKLLLKGGSNKEIALSLEICQKTVEEHLTSIYAKIGVRSRVEAVLWGMEQTRGFPHR
jgi:DNA-binding NarL/FixJ family response regulator